MAMASPTSRMGRAKRPQVANACASCQMSKVKCSGDRPMCIRCRKRGIECSYEVLEGGMTKREAQSRELCENREVLRSALTVLDVMRHGSDMLATETLARLRMGSNVEDVVKDLRMQYPSLPDFALGETGSNSSQALHRTPESVETASDLYLTPSSTGSTFGNDQGMVSSGGSGPVANTARLQATEIDPQLFEWHIPDQEATSMFVPDK